MVIVKENNCKVIVFLHTQPYNCKVSIYTKEFINNFKVIVFLYAQPYIEIQLLYNYLRNFPLI